MQPRIKVKVKELSIGQKFYWTENSKETLRYYYLYPQHYFIEEGKENCGLINVTIISDWHVYVDSVEVSLEELSVGDRFCWRYTQIEYVLLHKNVNVCDINYHTEICHIAQEVDKPENYDLVPLQAKVFKVDN